MDILDDSNNNNIACNNSNNNNLINCFGNMPVFNPVLLPNDQPRNADNSIYDRPIGPISPQQIAQQQYIAITQWLDQQQHNGNDNDIQYESWHALVQKNIHSNTAIERKRGPWRPFKNGAEFGLFILYYSLKFHFSELQIQGVIELLLMLRQAGYLSDDYYIPKNSKTVGQLKRYFPIAPLS